MTEQLPLVTVVIPTHNRSAFLREAISSVVRQSYQELEVIVVDDASSDDTQEVVAAIADPRIVYVQHREARGGAAARNSGIRTARGKYVALLDDDDQWVPHYLETQMREIGVCDVILSNAVQKTTGRIDGQFDKPSITLNDLKLGFVFGAGASTIIARTSILRETLFDEELPCKQDWDLMVRLAAKASIKYSKQPLVIFNNGTHTRITNMPALNVPVDQLEKQLTAYYKHRDFLGPFWFRYQLARSLLYFREAGNRELGSLSNIFKTCGLLAPALVPYTRWRLRLRRRPAAEPVRSRKTGRPSLMQEPSVSAVIPTHNRAPLLAKAIDSARQQTYPVAEIIVVDDNSSDETQRIVAAIDDPRIKYIRHADNKGGSAARNTGIEAATSDYIAFLDDDDEWYPDKTEKQLQVNQGCDAVLCGTRKRYSERRPRKLTDHTISTEELKRGFIFPGGTSNLMVKSTIAKQCRFDESLPSGQDWDMLIRLTQAWTVMYMSAPLVIYNDGEHPRMGNAAANLPVEKLLSRAKIVEKHKTLFGPYWTRYHIAGYLLSNFQHRTDKLQHATYALRTCGPTATLRLLFEKLWRRLS